MTQQEQELIKGLTERVNGTTLASKDSDAEQMLRSALGSNPDALYILCQTVLVQQFAMDKAQRELTETQAEVAQLRQQAKPEEHGSFLGNLFGLGKGDNASSQPRSAAVQPASGYAPVNNMGAPPTGYVPTQQPYGYGGGAPSGSGMFGGGVGGGFLQGAMQTAAGVVAGEFAFRALENVFSGFGGEGRGFSGGTEVVNDYYSDNDGRDTGDSFGNRLRDADGMSGGVSEDIEDRRGQASGFFGSGDDNGSQSFGDASGFSDDQSDATGFDGGDSDDGSGNSDDY